MMNAQTLYSINQDLNDQLLSLRRRMQRLTQRVVGEAPPSPTASLAGVRGDAPTPVERAFLDELGGLAHANLDVVIRIETDLAWFEDNFNLRDQETKAAYAEGSLSTR